MQVGVIAAFQDLNQRGFRLHVLKKTDCVVEMGSIVKAKLGNLTPLPHLGSFGHKCQKPCDIPTVCPLKYRPYQRKNPYNAGE